MTHDRTIPLGRVTITFEVPVSDEHPKGAAEQTCDFCNLHEGPAPFLRAGTGDIVIIFPWHRVIQIERHS